MPHIANKPKEGHLEHQDSTVDAGRKSLYTSIFSIFSLKLGCGEVNTNRKIQNDCFWRTATGSVEPSSLDAQVDSKRIKDSVSGTRKSLLLEIL